MSQFLSYFNTVTYHLISNATWNFLQQIMKKHRSTGQTNFHWQNDIDWLLFVYIFVPPISTKFQQINLRFLFALLKYEPFYICRHETFSCANRLPYFNDAIYWFFLLLCCSFLKLKMNRVYRYVDLWSYAPRVDMLIHRTNKIKRVYVCSYFRWFFIINAIFDGLFFLWELCTFIIWPIFFVAGMCSYRIISSIFFFWKYWSLFIFFFIGWYIMLWVTVNEHWTPKCHRIDGVINQLEQKNGIKIRNLRKK